VVRLLPGFGVGLLQRGPDAHRLLAFELAVEPFEQQELGLFTAELRDLVQLRVDAGFAHGEGIFPARQLVGASVQALLRLVEPQRARVLLLAAAVETFVLLIELLAVAADLVARLADLGALALELLAGTSDVLEADAARPLQLLLEACPFAALLVLPATPRLGHLSLDRGGRLADDAVRFLFRLRQPLAGAALRDLGGVGFCPPAQDVGDGGADDDAEEKEQDDLQRAAHASPSSCA